MLAIMMLLANTQAKKANGSPQEELHWSLVNYLRRGGSKKAIFLRSLWDTIDFFLQMNNFSLLSIKTKVSKASQRPHLTSGSTRLTPPRGRNSTLVDWRCPPSSWPPEHKLVHTSLRPVRCCAASPGFFRPARMFSMVTDLSRRALRNQVRMLHN